MFKNVQNTVPPKKAEHRKMLPTWLKKMTADEKYTQLSSQHK